MRRAEERRNRMGGQEEVSPTRRKFSPRMQKKLVVLYFLVLLAFIGLSIKIFQINRDKGEEYKRQVLSQQEYDSTTLPFKRGDILDRNGTILASSEKVYNLIVDSKALLKKEEYMQPTLDAIAACFQADVGEIRKYATENPSSRYRVFAKQLTYNEISAFEVLRNEDENKNIQGVWFEEEYKRFYPNGSLACDAIGFTGKDNVGTYGLEEFYNDILNGTNGREYGYMNTDSALERTVKPAIDGRTILTTLDANVQSIVEKYLKEFNEEHKNVAREGLGANNLGCIVMEVNTGNVLAMASYPDFDLNNPKDISAYYTEEQIAEMEANDTLYDTYNNLWRNFCISDTYEPGSTIKPFTVAAALDAGKITGNETYNCTGMREIGGYKIRCHNRYGDGLISVKGAVEQSCNVALMYIADTLNYADFCKYQHNFNFGLKTNIDLSGEARTEGLVYNADNMGPTERATNSFGQSFNVTMIQMISGFCSLVNGGYYYEPHMVSRILDSGGATVQTIEPKILKQTVSRSVSDKIVDYCNGVVINGTGKTARPAGYAIGGKTGTAQTLPRGNGEYIVSFMGYAPADNPQIMVYMVVDRPNADFQDQARYATILVRKILTEALPYLNIFMTEEVSEQEKQELDALQMAITTSYQEKAKEEENGGAEQESEAEGEGESEPVWKSFEKDPATGFYVDPTNGHFIDPDTGNDLSDNSFMGDGEESATKGSEDAPTSE